MAHGRALDLHLLQAPSPTYHRPPPIEVSAADTLIVHASNSLDETTSLHHHGMLFNGTSWMDGAVGLGEWCASQLRPADFWLT